MIQYENTGWYIFFKSFIGVLLSLIQDIISTEKELKHTTIIISVFLKQLYKSLNIFTVVGQTKIGRSDFGAVKYPAVMQSYTGSHNAACFDWGGIQSQC